jgi:aconitate hydratase
VSELAQEPQKERLALEVEVGLIGSCTNSSYEDITRAASIARQAKQKNLKVKANSRSRRAPSMVRHTIERDGLLADFEEIGGQVLANACGPCIGQWSRITAQAARRTRSSPASTATSPSATTAPEATHAFVASPEMVTALAWPAA